VFFAIPPLYTIQQPGPSRIKEPAKDFHFRIHHEKGIEEISLDVAALYEKEYVGWTSLGTYSFSGDHAWIELSDESKGKLVFADAIKWVKR